MTWPKAFTTRKSAYCRLLLDSNNNVGPDAALVLADLKRFCFADRSTLVVSPVSRIVDTHATMVAEGRREVWNRIQGFLNLNDRQTSQLIEEETE